jgi:sterol desaturase/sphingolipid hydroxylase (fatty acid hydroxylase superfamily)
MNFITEYFAQIPSLHRSAILVGGIMFFWLLEGAWPLFQFQYNKWRHAGVNIFFTITTILVNFPLAFLLLLCSDFCVNNQLGILQWIPTLPFWLYTVIGLMILDFIGAWLAHWTQHKTKWLWQFHIVHHSDHEVDTTTANRHHPGESLVRFIFTMAAILIAGAPMWLIFLYQSLSVILSQFNHANIVLPSWLHKSLSLIIVTPNMHHIHHHYVQPYTDSNYGNIFSIWDRLFGTYKSLPQSDIIYGIDTHPDAKENNSISSLLKVPFGKYRPPVGK